MIPQAYLQAWSATAPWPDFRQIEQDLIICRALCDLFSAPALRGRIAFRGGTAIHKLLFARPLRYSEDIDLVQMQLEPIGTTVDAIREAPEADAHVIACFGDPGLLAAREAEPEVASLAAEVAALREELATLRRERATRPPA